MPKLRSLYERCRFKEAVRDCEDVLRANSSDEDALWVGAMSHRELRDFKTAAFWFRKLLHVNPSRPGAQMYATVLERCLDSRDAWEGPIDVCEQGKSVNLPQGASALFEHDYNEMGLYMLNQGAVVHAVEWFDMALTARPKHAIAWFNKGIALARSCKFAEAIGAFDEALRVEPRYVDALYSKAGCEFELGNYRAAVDCYDEVISLNPNDIEAQRCRSEAVNLLNGSRTEAGMMANTLVCEHCGKLGQGDLSSSPPRLPDGWLAREILDVENRKAYIAIVCSEACAIRSAQSGSYLKWGRSRDL